MSRDEARFPVVPTLAATPGVEGHRPTVGTRDDEGLVYVLAVVNLATAAVHANTPGAPARAKRATGRSETGRRSRPTGGTSAGCTRRTDTRGWCR